MGLDAVELVIEVEEAFGIKIDDADAESIQTVGDLWTFIRKKIEFAPAERCATAASFYRLRRNLNGSLKAGTPRLRPSTPLYEIVPERGRRVAWKSLEQSLQLRLPELELKSGFQQAPFAMAGLSAATIALALFMAPNVHSAVAVAIVLLSFFASVVFWYWAITPFRTHVSSSWDTIGGLSRAVVGLNPQAWNAADKSHEVGWERLRAIIAEQLGVSLDQVHPEASFVTDLGMS